MRFFPSAAAFALASIPAVALADRVTLKNGTTIDGTVTEQKPGAYVVMKLEGGRERTFVWSDVDSFSAGGKTTSTSAAAPAPSATAPGPAAATAPVAKPSDDCATSTDVRCTQKTDVDVGKGLAVGTSTESVTKLKQPGNGYTAFAFDLGFLGGGPTSGDGSKILGGSAELGLQTRIGGRFPDEHGGNWSGLGLDANLGFSLAGLTSHHSLKIENEVQILQGGGVVGYQFFHFFAMDEASLKQHGVGFFVGARVGFASVKVVDDISGNVSATSAQYGPEIQLSFPSYNFGNETRRAFYVKAFALPTGDFFFASLALGGSFAL